MPSPGPVETLLVQAITRDKVRAACIRELPQRRYASPDEIEKRREVIERIRKRARKINLGVTHDEIKAWINEGRH